MSRTTADEMAALLAAAGVQRVYGRTGMALSPMPEALQRHKRLRCIGLQSEESAACAAVGESMLTGALSVCCGSSGNGNLMLSGGLYEAMRSKLPILALAPHIPLSTIGTHYFQETSPTHSLRDCSLYCEQANTAAQAQQVLREALRQASVRHGAAVTVLPSDVADLPVHTPPHPEILPYAPRKVQPETSQVIRLAELINNSPKVVFLCGKGCEGSRDLIIELAGRVGAPIAYTLRAKDIMERENPCAVGMIGLLGWGDAPAAVQVADLLVMWGTDFPYSCYLPKQAKIAQVDADATVLGRRTRLCHAVHGDVGKVAAELLPLIRPHRPEDFLMRSLLRHRQAVSALEGVLRDIDERAPMRPEVITRLISTHAEPDAIFSLDIGSPVIWAARYLQAIGKRRIIGSFNFGNIGCALPLAIGAKAACPSRQVIALSHADSPCTLLAELHSLLREKLSIKICVYNTARPSAELTQGAVPTPHGIDFAALAAASGLESYRLSTPDGATTTIRRWLAARGPALLDAALDPHALPQPPDSPMLRTLDHLDSTAPQTGRQELQAIRRLLFGNCRFY